MSNLPNTTVCSFKGVQDQNGKYLVGGHLGFNQKVKAAGTTIVYEHKRKNYRDSVTIAGPTNAILKVMVSTCVPS